MRGFLTSKQPVWRVTIVTVLAISLIFGISVNSPSQALQPTEELIMEILQNDSEFLKVFGEEINEIEIIHTTDNVLWVNVSGTSTIFMVEIDLYAKKINSYDGSRDPNDAEKTVILQVLNADPRASLLLGGGATIKYKDVTFASSPFQHSAFDKETTAAAWIDLRLDPPQVFEVNNVDLREDFFSIWVDLVHEELSPFIYINYGCMTDAELAQIIDILRADYRTSTLLDEGSIIDMSKYENVQVNISIDVGAWGDPSGEITDAERMTVEKLVIVYMHLGNKYYKADVDAVNRAISWFGEIEKP